MRRERVIDSFVGLACALATLAGLLVSGPPAAAQPVIADVRQGTNLSVAAMPGGTTLVIDLLGQLWKLPVTGGGAEPLTEPGEPSLKPRVSGDGRLIVYQRLVAGHWDLWLLDVATREQKPLTATASDERDPEFTADGRSVVFATNRTGHYCLWSISLDGRVETQLTEESGDASSPAVSEKGVIAYVLDRGGESMLRVLGPDGAATTLYSGQGRLTAPSWRPGDGVIVFGEQVAPGPNRLQMLLLDEARLKKALTEDEDSFASRVAWLSATELVYAADGQLWRRRLAHPTRQPVHLFAAVAVNPLPAPSDMRPLDDRTPRPVFGIAGRVRSRDGRHTAFTALGDLWLLERGEPERLTNDAFVEIDPAFAPDGESLVFSSERSGQFELWKYSLRDRRFTQLTFGAMKPHMPVVSPDGKHIAFLEADGLAPWAPQRLKVLSLPGGQPVTVATDLVDARALQWSEDSTTLRVHGTGAQTIDRPATKLHVELIRDLVADQESGTSVAGTAPPVALQWQPHAPPDDFVLEVDRLFDGVHADYRRYVDVHVRAGRIAAIAARGTLPRQGKVIALPNATVIPGLIDLHAHQTPLAGERLGRAWLAYGVTTVREVSANIPDALARAETWASGRSAGPNLIVSPAAGVPTAALPRDPRAAVRSLPGIANGFAHTLAAQPRSTDPTRSIGSARTYAGALESPFTPYELELSPGFRAYQDGFSRLLAAGAVFTPGLAPVAGLGGWPDRSQPWRRDPGYAALFTPAETADWTRDGASAAVVPALEETVTRLIRAGGRVAVGSDAPAVPYGLGLHLELALLAAAGLSNDQVLRLATVEGALALGIERDVGTLEEGKLADMVVIEGDPLARLTDALRITAVVKGGVWLDRAALLQRP